MRSMCNIVAVMPVLMAQLASYSFAGLSPHTTMVELKARYPSSPAVGGLIHVAENESHDGVSTVAVRTEGAVKILSITFERAHGSERRYPLCEKMLGALAGQYGAPSNVVEAQEERARNRRYEWAALGETMTLSCFSLPRQPMYAERLVISSPR